MEPAKSVTNIQYLLKTLSEASHNEARLWFDQQPDKDPLIFLQFILNFKK